jgi:hypothetical protein
MESYSFLNPLAKEESIGIVRDEEKKQGYDGYIEGIERRNLAYLIEKYGIENVDTVEKETQEIEGVEEQEHVYEYLRRKIGYQGLYNILNPTKD